MNSPSPSAAAAMASGRRLSLALLLVLTMITVRLPEHLAFTATRTNAIHPWKTVNKNYDDTVHRMLQGITDTSPSRQKSSDKEEDGNPEQDEDDEEREEGSNTSNISSNADKNALQNANAGIPSSPSHYLSSAGIKGNKHPSSNSHGAKTATVRSSLGILFQMCRPSNFAGVVLFHLLGVYTAFTSVMNVAGASGTKISFAALLINPGIVLTLVSLLLISSSSMVVNDYYDSRAGVDLAAAKDKTNPLVSGQLTPAVVKRFASMLYLALLLTLVALPGVATRVTGVLASVITFWYTVHLKPWTWLKNISCAVIIALSPLTSGAAAMAVLQQYYQKTASSRMITLFPVLIQNLSRLVATLFLGFLGREILMDVKDYNGDKAAGIVTVPVKYGRRFATNVSLLMTTLMGIVAVAFIPSGGDVTKVWVRRALASVGSLAMIRRSFQAHEKVDSIISPRVVDQAIEEGKYTILLVLASFL